MMLERRYNRFDETNGMTIESVKEDVKRASWFSNLGNSQDQANTVAIRTY
jgi:hypothetical protein